jgi:hypothetical protein
LEVNKCGQVEPVASVSVKYDCEDTAVFWSPVVTARP